MSDSPNPVGRPTNYKPEYCEKLVEHMSKGLSYETFAGTIDTHKQTLYDWEKANPEFMDAKKRAFEKCRIFWEQIAIDHLVEHDKGSKLNSSVWIFNMKNRFRWTDRQEIEAGEETKNLIKLAYNL